MKTVEELRKLLETGQTGFKPLKTIYSDTIVATNGTTHNYDIVQGWDIGLAMQCDQEWGNFNMQLLEFIRQADPCSQEKLLESSQLEDAHWNWLTKHKHYHSEQYNWFFFMSEEKPQAACLVYHPKVSVDTA
ncbi:N-acetyltransferase, partial [Vibrio parahaemolyticus]|nr:N-acetyltransferase [Vibrio parahaemolyticus]